MIYNNYTKSYKKGYDPETKYFEWKWNDGVLYYRLPDTVREALELELEELILPATTRRCSIRKLSLTLVSDLTD